MQRMRENQQNQNLGRGPGMMQNQFMRANMAARNGMMNGNMPNTAKVCVTRPSPSALPAEFLTSMQHTPANGTV